MRQPIIEPDSNMTFLILISFNKDATNRSFRLALKDLVAHDASGTNLELIDSDGNLLSESDAFETESITVVPDNAKEAFRNYPNPFGRQYEETTIVFYLEKDSDVELRIFTLTGGLVRTWQINNRQEGLWDDIKWNGKNDRGHRVLNGVYLCQIIIKATGQTYMTKIAYIK